MTSRRPIRLNAGGRVAPEDSVKPVTILVAFALIVAACGNPPSQSPASTTVEPGPTITTITTDLERTWSPAWELPSDMSAELEAVLPEAGVWILVPTAAPPAQPGESLSAEIRLSHTVPVGESVADMVVRSPDGSVFLSVQSRPVGEEPICGPRLYPAWSTETIRDVAGCSLQAEDAISFLAWTEDGQDFVAQFGPELHMAEATSWLDSWGSVGAS